MKRKKARYFEVLITAYRSVIVEVKAKKGQTQLEVESEAMEAAGDCTSFFGWEHDETKVEKEFPSKKEAEDALRFSNESKILEDNQ